MNPNVHQVYSMFSPKKGNIGGPFTECLSQQKVPSSIPLRKWLVYNSYICPFRCIQVSSFYVWVSNMIPGHSCPALVLVEPRCFGCQTWFLVTAARPCFDRTSLFWVSDIIPGHSCPALFLIQPRCWIAGGPGWFVHNSRPATVVYP